MPNALHMGDDYRELGTSVPVAELVDPKLWRERYAWMIPAGQVWGGVTFKELIGQPCRPKPPGSSASGTCGTDDDDADLSGFGFPDSVVRWHLRAALSELEMRLTINLGMQLVHSEPLVDGEIQGRDFDVLEPRRTLATAQVDGYAQIQVLPDVIRVDRVRGIWYGTTVLDLKRSEHPDALTITHPKEGVIAIRPPLGYAAITTPTPYSWLGLPSFWFSRGFVPVPGFWAVDYLRGPISKDGKPGHIEAVFANWVYAAAGLTLLALDSAARSRGLASSSLTMDGVSRSVTLAKNGDLNAVLTDAFDRIDKSIDWKATRLGKRGLRLRPFDG